LNSSENAKLPVIDFHCDLLCYLVEIQGSTPLNREARCSFPQLQEGGVKLQAMAAFTETKPGSSLLFQKQVQAFRRLPEYSKGIQTCLAIENASGLVEEDEPLDLCFKRLDQTLKEVGKILYVSLTWNTENRFAGGNYSDAGLKADGKALLDYLSGKDIAIDFSHTSDATAEGILEHIDAKGLKIKVLASHSNFRAVTNHVRNLPDHIAKEIIRRGGLIGLVLVRAFVGEPYEAFFLKMVEHGQKLGARDQLAIGADFFYEGSVPPMSNLRPFFVTPYDTSACYPKILALLDQKLATKLAYQNAEAFLERK
jgi:membrane dipeptidase